MFILLLAYQRDTRIITRSSTILIKMGILDKTWMDKRWRKVSLLVTSIITVHTCIVYVNIKHVM